MSHFIWYDLMTAQKPAVLAFYEHVVGWKSADSGVPGMSYTVLKAGDVMVAGIDGLPPDSGDMHPPWHGHIYSADVDRDCKRVVEAGGTLHMGPFAIATVGRFAIVSDPGGASFILFKPDGEEQAASVPMGTPGHIGWRELHAHDLEAAWAFYQKLFGWKQAGEMPMPDGNAYRMFSTGRSEMDGGMMTKQQSLPQAAWVYYFNAGNIDEASARIQQRGGTVVLQPMQVPGGQWALNALDPQGHLFGLLGSR
jgi:predicted enzyme related to lactoylglutathione lyase